MALPNLRNSHETSVAFYFETAAGTTPADAAAWAAAMGTDGFRLKTEEASIEYILGVAAVENVDMQEAVYQVDLPHKGLPTADGGTIKTRLWSHGDTWNDDTQVLAGTHSELGRLLKHALGRGELGHYTSVSVVTNQTTFTLASGSNVGVGYPIGFEDADAPGKIHHAIVLTVAGADITTDRAMPFTVAPGDKVYGAEFFWPQQEALTEADDPDFSTLSLLYCKGPHAWMVGGAHLMLNELATERGQQPKLTWGVLGAYGYPQGAGAPSVPSWSDQVVGLTTDVAAIGHGTRLFYQVRGTTTYNSTSVAELKFTPGVPVEAEDAVTEAMDGFPGRMGYRAARAATDIEMVVVLEDGEQDRWTQGTLLTVTYSQVTSVGRGWGLHIAKAFVKSPPVPATQDTNKWRVTLQATHDIDATVEPRQAKFLLFFT